jgi:hypothetical protein
LATAGWKGGSSCIPVWSRRVDAGFAFAGLEGWLYFQAAKDGAALVENHNMRIR